MHQVNCRYCSAPLHETLVNLGEMPFANSFLPNEPEEIAKEQRWPLHAMICTKCWLVQLEHEAPVEEIFSNDYVYLSSYSTSWVEHARNHAVSMAERFHLGPSSLVIEVASNDGYLLQHFVNQGIHALGIEPAGQAAEIARGKGVESRVEFFNSSSAPRIAAEGYQADLMVANNVLAHVPDTRDFVSGFPMTLKPEGVITFEFPHLLNLIEQLQFDTIYHEHYSYLSLAAVERILASAGLRVFDVEQLPTHGGSLRVFACHDAASHENRAGLDRVRALERAAGIETMELYRSFGERIEKLRRGFCAFLSEMRGQGSRVAAYGAAAKGNTFLNYCGIGTENIFMVADRNPQKQHLLLPGSHIPVVTPEELLDEKPDYIIILPWNLRDEIAESLAEIRDWGGRFVVVAPGSDTTVEIF